jgi:PAS domain-containing protein
VVEYLNPRAEQFFGFDLENVPRIEEWFDSFGDPEISARAHDLWKYIQNTYPVHVEKIVSARIQSGDFERIKLRALSLDSEKVLIICDKADEE